MCVTRHQIADIIADVLTDLMSVEAAKERLKALKGPDFDHAVADTVGILYQIGIHPTINAMFVHDSIEFSTTPLEGRKVESVLTELFEACGVELVIVEPDREAESGHE